MDADLFIKDGTISTISTTLSASASKGASTIAVTAATGISAGKGIAINNSLEDYVVTGVSGTTVSIAPELTMAVASTAPVVGISNMLEVHLGEGTLTYNEKRAVTYKLNRGRIYSVVLGDDSPVEVSMAFLWEFLRAPVGDPPTVEEALKQIGAASNWVSTSTDPCEPYCVDIVISWPPPCGDVERITLRYFRWESLNHDAKAASVSVSGNCNVSQALVEHSVS